MARFTGGWYKTHRSLFDHWIGKDVTTFGFFVQLVGLANIKPSKLVRNGSFIEIQRGQLLTSSLELAARMGVSRGWIERRLDLLESDGTIEQQKDSHGRIITICNYNDYQDSENEEKQQTDRKKAALDTTLEQRSSSARTRSKEAKNNKKERSKEIIQHEPPNGSSPTVEILAAPSPAQKFISRYCEVYKQKYSVNPVINGQAAGIAKKIVEDLGLMRASVLIEKYLQMNDRWFITKHHDLSTFVSNLNKIELFKETGIKITQSQAHTVELEDSNRQVIENYFKEKGGE